MKIYIEKQKKQLVLNKSLKGIDLLTKLKINPETVLIVKNGSISLPDEILKKNDEVKILSVVSGG